MKVLMFTLTLGLFPALTYAGVPDEDPVVAHLRQEFQNAKIPNSVRELRPEKSWTCVSYSALKGNFFKTGPEATYRFEAFDGILRNTIEGISFPWNLTDYAPAQCGFVAKDFSRIRPPLSDRPTYSFTEFNCIRITSAGELIIERSSMTNDSKPDPRTVLPAIGFTNTLAELYSICKIEDITK